jgi:hypothetical protein
MELLRVFAKPHDVNHILTWQTIRQTLGESTEDAIERFVRAGVLIPATLEESLSVIFQVAELKKLLKERGVKQSGNKSELVEKLIDTDRIGAEKLLAKHRVMKCSESILSMLENQKIEKAREFEYTQKQSFELLQSGNAKEAYRIYAKFQKKYSSTFYASSYEVEELQYVLSSCPAVLGNLTAESKRLLQAAAGMKILWREDKAEYWLPENFTTNIGDNRRAINYLIRNAGFRKIIEGKEEFPHKVRINFQDGDIESCQLCLKLKDKVFAKDKVPELPMIGCTSETGCMCDLDIYFEDDDNDFSENDEIEVDGIEDDPVKKLKILKQLLDEGLITQAEYNDKKKEILSRL